MSGNGKLVQTESTHLYSSFLQLLEFVDRDKTVISNLLDELDRTRREWKRALDLCQHLERQIKMEQEKSEKLTEENLNMTAELSFGKIQEGPDHTESPLNKSRKRSIAPAQDDDAQLPRKVRRSSSVPPPCLTVPNSAPCNRGLLTRVVTSSLENARPQRRSLGDEDICISDPMISRQHGFVTKRNYISGVKCELCSQSIRYCVLYKHCNACKQSYHEQCSRKLEMPCLPRLLTPKRDSKTIKTLRLVDYCPDSTPRIPHFVVLCAMHLEKTSTEERVYVALENENAAAKLLTDFKTSRHSPDLSAHDNQTVATCLMMFLMEIREPLIPTSSSSEFFMAQSQDELLTVFSSLPLPHRETLAYLLSHWKRLIEATNIEDFTTESLSNFMGPVVFGTSRHLLADNSKTNDDARAALQRLIELSYDLLKAQVSRDDSGGFNNTPLSRNGSNSQKNKPVIVLSTVNA